MEPTLPPAASFTTGNAVRQGARSGISRGWTRKLQQWSAGFARIGKGANPTSPRPRAVHRQGWVEPKLD